MVENKDLLKICKESLQWNDYESSLGKIDLSEYLYDSLHPKYKIEPDEMNQQALLFYIIICYHFILLFLTNG